MCEGIQLQIDLGFQIYQVQIDLGFPFLSKHFTLFRAKHLLKWFLSSEITSFNKCAGITLAGVQKQFPQGMNSFFLEVIQGTM